MILEERRLGGLSVGGVSRPNWVLPGNTRSRFVSLDIGTVKIKALPPRMSTGEQLAVRPSGRLLGYLGSNRTVVESTILLGLLHLTSLVSPAAIVTSALQVYTLQISSSSEHSSKVTN